MPAGCRYVLDAMPVDMLLRSSDSATLSSSKVHAPSLRQQKESSGIGMIILANSMGTPWPAEEIIGAISSLGGAGESSLEESGQ
jgi:hypothetical protein